MANRTRTTPSHRAFAIVGTLLLTCISLLTSTNTLAQNKNIYVTSDHSQATLDFSFTPTADYFEPHAPITFNIRSNQDVFLYVYTLNPDGSYTLILPNFAQSQNKYPANTTVPVPNPNVQFRADGTAAVETVFAVASTRYIDLEIAKQKRAGDFTIHSAKTMEDKFASKGIVIRDVNQTNTVQTLHAVPEPQPVIAPSPSQPAQPAPQPAPQPGSIAETVTYVYTAPPANAQLLQESTVRRVDINIGQPVVDQLITFVATDRTNYRVNDTIQVVYGATQPGSVSLYIIEPGGTPDLPVATANVDGSRYERLNIRHSGTPGQHVLRAVYSTKPAEQVKAINVVALDQQTAGSHAEMTLNIAQ